MELPVHALLQWPEKDRGLASPLLIISDGAPGLIAAIEQAYPKALRQRCLIHRSCKRINLLCQGTGQSLARMPWRLSGRCRCGSQLALAWGCARPGRGAGWSRGWRCQPRTGKRRGGWLAPPSCTGAAGRGTSLQVTNGIGCEAQPSSRLDDLEGEQVSPAHVHVRRASTAGTPGTNCGLLAGVAGCRLAW